jgi:Kef-type K+ transport system membrane component KefB
LLATLAVVIVAARLLGIVFAYFRQPPVVGEMVAGILLGPSLLGRVWPQAFAEVMRVEVAPMLSAIGQIGVILYMFLVGMHLDRAQLRHRLGAVTAVSQTSIALPFALGGGLGLLLYSSYSTSDVPVGVFFLFMGLSMSVTAFPVLARILTDRGLARSELGSLALASAALNDVTAWCLLAFVVSVAKSDLADALRTTALCAAFAAFMVIAVRPALRRLAERAEVRGEVGHGMLGLITVAVLLSALATQWIGVHALFGAFLLGALVPTGGVLARHLERCLHDIVVVFMLPAYFAFTGLRTQIGLISGMDQWMVCAAIIAIATLGKVGGAMIGARLAGVGRSDSWALSVLMNTRGLMEIIVLNIGLDLHVLSPTLFSMLVLMAIATTMATTPVLDAFTRQTRRAIQQGAPASAPFAN